jgi:hypothetical protein
MGRHARPAPSAPPPDAALPAPLAVLGRLARLWPRLVLAATAGLTTTLVVAWAGTPWGTSALVGAGVAVVVLGAAWLATTVPPPARPTAPTAPAETGLDGGDARPPGPHAVQ